MFELSHLTPAKLTSVNNRAEIHGREAVPAVDLKFTFDASNAILSEFDDFLLPSLYYNAEPSDGDQEQLEGVEVISDMPNLRFPKLGLPLKWDMELSGYELTIDHGLGGKSNVVLADCKVNAFALEPHEGGTVTVSLRVQSQIGLTEKILGKLATLVQHDVQLMLTAPETSDQAPLVDAEGQRQKTPEEALAESAE